MSGPAALALHDARARILDSIVPVADVERVPLAAALGRVLAADLVAAVDVPPHDNAAMDGYAFAATAGVRTFAVVGVARAGHPHRGIVPRGGCVRILTGAMIPAGCDTVVAQEDATVDGNTIVIFEDVPPGRHRRRAGEDLAAGSVVLARGRRLTPADVGIVASLGEPTVTVSRRPRVAVFSTGNELREPGDALPEGAIRDANRYALLALLARLGVETIDLGIVGDDRAALVDVMTRAAGAADAVITSGGVSVGDADHTRDALARTGDVAFWSLAVKPGRPMAFGRIGASDGRANDGAWLFALPGNPVAMMVVFHALVRDALTRLAGALPTVVPTIDAVCDVALDKAPGRTEFVRGVLTRTGAGWHVRPTGSQGSGVLRSMSEADGLVVLAHERGPVAAGDRVEVWPFHGLL